MNAANGNKSTKNGQKNVQQQQKTAKYLVTAIHAQLQSTSSINKNCDILPLFV